MNLDEFKLQTLGIDKDKFQKIYTFVDFGNVNYWFKKDRRGFEGEMLNENKKIVVRIEKLSQFINLFAEQKRFYYGLDKRKKSTWHITRLAKDHGFKVVKKPIQWIKHPLNEDDIGEGGDFQELIKLLEKNKKVQKDQDGYSLRIPKCNFDVELTIDAIRLINNYETIALFSGDSDFSMLLRFLQKRNKKIILFYAGRISHTIKNYADLLINAQKIKKSIGMIKEIKRTPYEGVRKSDSYPRAG